MKRLALVCPGRGSYTDKSLGSLPADHPWIQAADRMRAELDLEPLGALDGAERFEPARHLRPANVSALIYLVSMFDAVEARRRGEVVAVAGNSMGWYTALAVGGALSFEDGFRLVQEMALLQEEGAPGGQILYPQVDDDWRRAPELEEHVRRALDASPGEVFPSIRLGGYAVLAGTSKGVSTLLSGLPKVQLGKTGYPFRLAQHGPYHTPLASPVAERARTRFASLAFRRPEVTLVDGRGRRHTPWSADLADLRAYTLGAQVDTPYDFTKSVEVVLKEEAPDELTLLGPGNTLGGVCGQILIELGWRGIRSRADFERSQEGEAAPLFSLRR